MSQTKGTIFNIQRYSLHDGPGIRDTVFMKGCPLQCQWCANPESQKKSVQLIYNKNKCIQCGQCVTHCKEKALSMDAETGLSIDRQRCTECHLCVPYCCTQGLAICGEQVSIEQLHERIQEKQLTWRGNNGITISGGEPLLQAEFVEELLKSLKQEGFDLAIETSGYGAYADLKRIVAYCDTVFFDLKHMDGIIHQQYTGVSNEVILQNLLRLDQEGLKAKLIVRTPLIPQVNDSQENLWAMVEFLSRLNHLYDVELLPYHNYGESKYSQLGKHYLLSHIPMMDKEQVRKLNQQIREKLGIALPKDHTQGQW